MYAWLHINVVIILFQYFVGGLILALIEGVGIAINRAVSEQFKPGNL